MDKSNKLTSNPVEVKADPVGASSKEFAARKAALHAKLLKRTSFAPKLKAHTKNKTASDDDKKLKGQPLVGEEEAALNR